MKVGDLVSFSAEVEGVPPSIGILVEIDDSPSRGYHRYGVMWDFLHGQIGWQYGSEIEVVSEGR